MTFLTAAKYGSYVLLRLAAIIAVIGGMALLISTDDGEINPWVKYPALVFIVFLFITLLIYFAGNN